MTKPQDLMDALKSVRIEWGLSPADLAEILGVAEGTIKINEWRTRNGMQIDDLCRWADALGCDVRIEFRGDRNGK